MNDSYMPDCYLVADDAWSAAVDVKDRAVLDVRSLSDANRGNVTADDGIEPDTRIRADIDVTDHD
jgi:hypothetical protein